MWCQEIQNSANRSQKSLTRPKHGEPVIPRRAPKPLQGAGDPSGEEGLQTVPRSGKMDRSARGAFPRTLYSVLLLSTLCSQYSLLSTYSLLSNLYSVLCTLYAVLCTLYSFLCTLRAFETYAVNDAAHLVVSAF